MGLVASPSTLRRTSMFVVLEGQRPPAGATAGVPTVQPSLDDPPTCHPAPSSGSRDDRENIRVKYVQYVLLCPTNNKAAQAFEVL